MKQLYSALMLTIMVSGSCLADDIWGTDGDFLDDNDNAKVQRHLAQQRALEAKMTPEDLAASQQRRNECGSLDVGNVEGGGRKVENVTVIKGDVINVAGQCRSRR
ncbi:hypothetical protein [Allohahella marinimesophila]|uniref:Uncharacterized protein n=1 Tax=Allohahella marinimesophila TaxID=1054972 RepID=A0ABP7PH80_9GAMM